MTGDGRVWNQSDLAHDIASGAWPPLGAATKLIGLIQVPFFFLADGAFRLSANTMKPYPGSNLSLHKRIYNKWLSRSRQVIEQAWGELSARFRFLRTDITWMSEDWEKEVSEIIYASMILHNLCKMNLDPAFPLEDADFKEQDIIHDVNPAEDSGENVRDALCMWAESRYGLSAGGIRLRYKLCNTRFLNPLKLFIGRYITHLD